MRSLEEIYQTYMPRDPHGPGTGDKGTVHSYIELYEELFTPYRRTTSILETMSAQHEEVPAWMNSFVPENPLTDTMFDAMLQSRVVFYPGSDCRDGLAFELFTHSHAVHCVIHADVRTDLATVVNAVTGIPGKVPSIRGYHPKVLRRLNQGEAREVLRLDEQPVPGLNDPNPMAQVPDLAGAVFSILERNPDFGDEHGPARLAFLHVKCEAAWLFWNLWLRPEPARPPAFGIIVAPEYGGSIERLFGKDGTAYHLEGGYAKRPDWILYDRLTNEEWPGYEIAATHQEPRLKTLIRRLPDDHPRVVGDHLRDVIIKGRWYEAEKTIANSEYKNEYLKAFPDAIDDWALLGWTDWMDAP